MSTAPVPTKMILSAGEQLAAFALGTVVLLGGCWWSAVMLCSRVSSGRWIHLDSTQLAHGLSHAVSHPQDPAGGLPPALSGHAPGPVSFYVAALLITVLVCLVLGLVWALLRGAFGTPGVLVRSAAAAVDRRRSSAKLTDGIQAGAQWARRSDLDGLVVRKAEPGRVTLGSWKGRLVAGQERHSVIVVGPPGSMKTTGMAVPAILEWQGPVLATSVKSDLLHDTLARREQLGDVFVFDPTESANVMGSTWTPLSRCDTWYGAQRTSSWLCQAVHSSGKGGGGDFDFWYAAAAKLLAPLLFAAAASGATMRDVVRWVNTQESDEVLDALERAGDQGAQDAWKATELRDNRQRSSIYTTTETVLDAYGDPRVLKASDGDQLTAAKLLDGGMHTAYVCAPADEQTRLRPLLSTLIYDVVAAAYARASKNNGPVDPPLLIVLDELANIAPLRDLDTLASTARGQGIQLVSIVQDVAQLVSRYGQERARTIVNNHHAKLVLSGVGDTETLEMVGKLIGDTALTQHSVSSGDKRGHSMTQSTSYRRLAPAELIRGQAPGTGLLIYGHLPAAQLKLRPWFCDQPLRNLAAADA